MGTYTTLAKFGSRLWEGRRYKGSGPERSEGPLPIEETRFVCAECSEYYPFDDSCPRCGRPVVDRTRALPSSKEEIRRPWLSMRSPMMILACVIAIGLPLAWIPLVEFFEGSRGVGDVLMVLGLIAGLAVAVPSVTALVVSTLQRRARRRRRFAARSAARQLTATRVDKLPAQTTEPVRIEGRLQFDIEDNQLRIRIVDETGAAEVPPRVRVRVRSAGGALEELDAACDGDEVEAVGMGRHHAVAAGDYRTVDQRFAFSDEAPIDIWVKKRG